MPRGHDKTATFQSNSKVTPKTLPKTFQRPYKDFPKRTYKSNSQRPFKDLIKTLQSKIKKDLKEN